MSMAPLFNMCSLHNLRYYTHPGCPGPHHFHGLPPTRLHAPSSSDYLSDSLPRPPITLTLNVQSVNHDVQPKHNLVK